MNYKPIPNYPNYIIYENGDIVNKNTNHKLKLTLSQNEPARVHLCNHNIVKHFNVSRLIYEVFNDIKLKKSDRIVFNDGNTNNYHHTNLVIRNEKHQIQLDPTKIWKICVANPNYKISNYGDIYSITTNKIIKSHINEYYRIHLSLNNVSEIYFIHHLVYKTFKGEVPEDKVIDHIDRNKLNNYIDNLQLATRSENSLNINPYKPQERKINQYSLNNEFIKEWESANEINKILGFRATSILRVCLGSRKSAFKFKWSYVDKITNLENYKKIKIINDDHYQNYMIDRKGNVINKNNILLCSQNNKNYKSIKLKSSLTGREKRFKIHRLVSMTFLDNPNNLPIVNHIDENRSNNDVNNLEWCDSSHNICHSIGKSVNQINITDGKIINTFKSIADAVRMLNKKSGSPISSVCKGKQKTAYGFKWEYAT